MAARLARYGVGFAEMDRDDQRARLGNLIKKDDGLKRTLLGAVVGHLTEAELDVYVQHKDEVRRTVLMLLARVQNQIDAVAVPSKKGRTENLFGETSTARDFVDLVQPSDYLVMAI